MTKEEIIQKAKITMELRGRSKSTIRLYTDVVKAYQDYHGKAAEQMKEEEIADYLHYLLTLSAYREKTVFKQCKRAKFGAAIFVYRNAGYAARP
jgi:hypothetical protein